MQTNIPTPKSFDTRSALATVWAALEHYREELIPEGEAAYDEGWDHICTAMAWLADAPYNEKIDEMALQIMSLRPDLTPMSLDEWVIEHEWALSPEELTAANAIISLMHR